MDRRMPVVVSLVVAALAALPAVASAAETITGHVTGPSSQNLQGICVAAHAPADPSIPGGLRGTTTTDMNGNYILNVTGGAGNYKVSFSSAPGCATTGTQVVTEFYNNHASFNDADLVAVSAGGTTPGIDAQLAFPPPPSGGTISGRVLNGQNNGFQGVCAAALDNAQSQVGNAGISDANGNFTLTNVPAGSYKVIFTTASPCPDGAAYEIETEYYRDKASFALADTVSVTDGQNTALLDVSLNSLPKANDDTYTEVEENTSGVVLDVDANDDEPDPNNNIEITAVSDPPHGTTTIQGTPGNRVILYKPDNDFCGATQDTFTYTVNGGDTANVSVTVDCFPVPNDDAATVDRNSGANTIDVLVNDTDGGDGGPKRVTAAGPANFGTVDITNGGANVSYTPGPNNCGTDDFFYQLNGNGPVAHLVVTINCPNAVNDAATVGEDSGANAVDVRANDTGNPKTVVTKTNGANGSVAIVGGGLTYTPNANFCGQDTFTYGLNGAPNPAAPATVTVTVTCVDDNPIAVGDSKTVDEDAAATAIDVLGNDTDVDAGAKSVASKTDGAHGTVAITGGGTGLTYTPAANYCGADSFTYALNGGSSATVNVTVTCVDDPPVTANDAATVGEDSGANAIDVLANDTDVDSPKTVAGKTDGAHGAAAITDSGAKVSYTPAADFCGTDSFTYTLTGGGTGTVSVTVTCVDDPPVAEDDEETIDEDAPATAIDVLENDTDVDGGTKLVTAISAPAHGTAAITGDGTGVTYQPAANYCGPDSFTYTLSGGSTGTVAMDVTCVDDEAPDTLITSGPKKKVKTFKRRVKVTFAFKPTEAGSTFRCKLDNGDFKTCKSPKSYRLRPGRHTFQVAAVDPAGNVDPTPAKRKVKVVRRRRG